MFHYCIETPQHIVISLAYGSPIIIDFLVLNIFAKFRRGPHTVALKWLNTGGVYTFRDFMSMPW